MKINDEIIDLLIIFDELDFIPTNLIPDDPVEYAIQWKKNLIKALEKI